MTASYSFTDLDGVRFEVSPSRNGNAVTLAATAVDTNTRVAVTVPAWQLRGLVAAMYRTAGEPVPVLLNPDEVADEWVRVTRTGGAA